ncbi:MAG: DUF2087 domain-containing protein [Aeromicrobium sp.]|nr:DUF2087 domain-containing protein [Burkholderiales bacterium]
MRPSPTLVPLRVADVSFFCKLLRQRLIEKSAATAATQLSLPSHLAMLNLIAKSAGYRNFQSLRADADSLTPHERAEPITLPRASDLPKPVLRALSHFDTHGRMTRFPLQLSIRELAMLALWCRLPAKRDLTEAEVNNYIAQFHTFSDNATLRRELVSMKLLWRTKDGRVYRKEAPTPSTDGQLFIKTLMKLTRRGPTLAS